MMHNKRWVVAPPLTAQADEALAKFPPILKQIVFNRGLATDAEARAFLKAEPNSNTDPFQMIGMEATVDRICYALQHDEPIRDLRRLRRGWCDRDRPAGAGPGSTRRQRARLHPQSIR